MKMESQIKLINIDNIIPNRFQPRLTFNEEGLDELVASIQEHGIIQPLVLRRVADKYEIIAGERRYKAASKAGLTSVPAIISDLDDNESAEVAIIENTHRRNLSALEEARSYKKLLDRKYVTQDQLAKRLGTSQSNIANKVRLLSLDENVQTALMKEQISERHARALLRVTDKLKQVELLNKIIENRWNVRTLEEEIDKVLGSYNKSYDLTGGINTSSRNDIDVNNIISNSQDIVGGDTYEHVDKYVYDGGNEVRNKKKDSLFFNNLENESVNLNPTLSFGFNPFQTAQINNGNAMQDDDVDMLDLDGDDDDDDTLTLNVNPNVSQDQVMQNAAAMQASMSNPVDVEYNSMDDVVMAIKGILSKAKLNEIAYESEEFSFDKVYQFVIRLDKETDDK